MSKRTQVEYYRRDSGFSTGFFWGLVLGAAGVFLFYTKQGKKLKKFLSEHGEHFIDEIEDIYEQVESGPTIIDRLVEPISNKKKKSAKIKSNTVQDKKTEKPVKDLGHISKLQERGRQAAKQFFTRGGRSLK